MLHLVVGLVLDGLSGSGSRGGHDSGGWRLLGDGVGAGAQVRDLALQLQEALAYAVEGGSEARLDLVELLRHQGQSAQQVVEVLIDLSHPTRDLANL